DRGDGSGPWGRRACGCSLSIRVRAPRRDREAEAASLAGGGDRSVVDPEAHRPERRARGAGDRQLQLDLEEVAEEERQRLVDPGVAGAAGREVGEARGVDRADAEADAALSIAAPAADDGAPAEARRAAIAEAHLPALAEARPLAGVLLEAQGRALEVG